MTWHSADTDTFTSTSIDTKLCMHTFILHSILPYLFGFRFAFAFCFMHENSRVCVKMQCLFNKYARNVLDNMFGNTLNMYRVTTELVASQQ